MDEVRADAVRSVHCDPDARAADLEEQGRPAGLGAGRHVFDCSLYTLQTRRRLYPLTRTYRCLLSCTRHFVANATGGVPENCSEGT